MSETRYFKAVDRMQDVRSRPRIKRLSWTATFYAVAFMVLAFLFSVVIVFAFQV